MTVSVASRLYRPAGLSEVGRLVLGFIDGGAQWLDWAMTDPQARYHFNDESALVAGVQSGLHGTPYLILHRLQLMVSPVKLMTMSVADLRTLARAEAGTDAAPSPANVAVILQAHGLASQADLRRSGMLTDSLRVADAAALQGQGLDAQLALLELEREVGLPTGGLAVEAASFAAARAQNPFEFADYFRACRSAWSVLPTMPTAEERAAAIAAAIDTLMPRTFAAIDCPSVEGLVAPWEVSAAISEWLLMGRQIGFARSSLAIQQIITNGGYTGQTGREADALVRNYLARAQVLLNTAEVGQGRLGQDGATCLFHVEARGDQADIELGPSGIITLRRFGAVPAPSPVPVPDPLFGTGTAP
ncbi:hypothetical protein [Sphingomonas sp. S2-65]|uniref:hypothetical protein n=1 Tax=Sphingomonas sp. S2-65 TaxID=2903960 RepID=UPI001F3ABE6D|nr:hypothetical protein [Sphingomonas sp. S2-65]UYY59379.1 hypothetical protein LZ586_04655 [Sphingomonas sp. S2-65]